MTAAAGLRLAEQSNLHNSEFSQSYWSCFFLRLPYVQLFEHSLFVFS